MIQNDTQSTIEGVVDNIEIAFSNPILSTVPDLVRQSERLYPSLEVYYISDIHLVHHLMKYYSNGATDEQIAEYIYGTVKKLFDGEFGTTVRSFDSPIVLFGGDISSSFKIAKCFFTKFIQTWNEILDKGYARFSEELIPLEIDMKKTAEEVEEWKLKHPWTKNATKPLSDYSDRKVPRKIKDCLEKEKRLCQAKNRIEDLLENCHKVKQRKSIYAILGNHELWDFVSYNDCVGAYKALFEELGIHFLNGSIEWLGPHTVPSFRYKDSDTGEWKRKPLKREDNPKVFDEQTIYSNNIIIAGDIGYAKFNPHFNANQGIYGVALNPEQETARWQNWLEVLNCATKYAEENRCALVVLTHMPVSDWCEDCSNFSNIAFFNGHTHRNIAWAGEKNVFFYCDGQIGYKREHFLFMHTRLYQQRNPFAGDSDGYREITCEEYKEFYHYLNEDIPGTGIIERQIRLYGSKLYVIKKDEYYGFFTVSTNKVCICNGGQLRTVGPFESMDFYYQYFSLMVKVYLLVLSPLRQIQERISSFVKGIGGSGKIHGTIVDIDYYNHIMVNSVDGSLVFYNSPYYGLIKPYSDLGLLLHEHCPRIESRFLKGNQSIIVAGNVPISTNPYTHIDIKNSPYAISRRVNALQRLFDKHILRDWNIEIILRSFEEIKLLKE